MIGFPLGTTSTRAKTFEAEEATARGANEVDMVVNVETLQEIAIRLLTTLGR